MKILAIRGRNMASLRGDFEVDLMAEPFASAGLFAITGPTGSGKSTLLDTLCLALFDRTPRLGGPSRVQVGREDEDEGDRLGANDVRGLLTRGTGSGFAEIDFRSSDGHRWRARWEVRRARERADGRLQPQTMSLESLESGDRIGGKKTEVLLAIRERIGLSFDQFRRSVLLAQGDFAAFLHASSPERAELLEKITGTTIYARVSRAVYERKKQEEEALGRLEQQRQALGVLSREEREALEDEHTEAAVGLVEARQTLETAERDLRWYSELARLRQREEQGEQALAEANGVWETARERRQTLERIRAAQPLRPHLERRDRAAERRDQARQQVDRASDTLEGAREKLALAEASLAEARASDDAAKQERTAKTPELDKATLLDDRLDTTEQQARLAAEAHQSAERESEEAEQEAGQAERAVKDSEARLHQAETWLEAHPAAKTLSGAWKPIETALRDHARVSEEVRGAREALPALEESEQQTRQVAERAEERSETTRRALETLQQEVDETEKAIPEGRREPLDTERQRVSERREILRKAEEALAEAERLHGEREGARAKAEAARERERIALDDVGASEAALGALEIRLDEARRTLATSRALRDLASRRAELVAGEPCPLCGSTTHPYGHEGAPDPELEARRERVETLETEGKALTTRRAADEEKAKGAAAEAEQNHGLAQSLDGRLGTPRARWAEVCATLTAEPPAADLSELPEGPLDEAAAPAIETAVAKTEELLADLARRIREHGELEKKAQASRQARDAARKERDEGLAVVERARDAARRAADALAAGQRRLDEPEQRLAQLLDTLASSLPDHPDWRPGWRDELRGDSELFLVSCRDEAEAFESQTQARQRASQELATLRPRAAETAEKARAAHQVASEKKTELDKNLARVAELMAERAAVLGGRPVAEVRQTLDSAIREAEQALDTALKHEQEARAAFKVAESQLESARARRSQESADFDEAETTLGTALAELELDLATLRQRLGHDAAWCDEETRALDALRQAIRDAEKVLEERREVRREHEQTGRPEVSEEEAKERRESALEAHRQADETTRQLQVRLRTDDEARAKAEALATEIAAQASVSHRWGQLNEVVGSADGSKFRKFAQGLTLDSLLGHANAHLRDLAPRYHLQRIPGEDLELQVIDLDMGDEVRSINSLSGGETFLASLALALGLSSLSSSEAPVESLFIDEGFGTLDPQTLEIALATFDALQATGRQIGIISHVRDLDERIGIQLKVVKLGAGRSRLEVVGGVPPVA